MTTTPFDASTSRRAVGGSRALVAMALCAAIGTLASGCAQRPAVPEWQMNAHGAADKATEAYLSGADRVAAQEWRRARSEVARTARPDLLARVVLLECAARVASLAPAGCADFEPLRADAAPAERAYADYLAGRADPAAAALLPPAQQSVQTAGPSALPAVGDPLARLVAAGALMVQGRATPEVARLAIEAASAQGWRRPLMAWLSWAADRAAERGDAAEAEGLRRRLEVLERSGG
ncbi:hypothetical protein [Acidovorax sp. NCPPB 4044]|uniref:hypothetical protein n=1 Tax=Acidovorax sp. NCPPB 4044 TaxID=2940490 RepID=UPI003FA46853